MKRYFVMFLQLTTILLAFGGLMWVAFLDLSWLIKFPIGAIGFSAALTFAFACDEYHSNPKDKLLQ